ncbi:hypothetical protein BKA62DRAFT_721935 [Auriculariales sp. MPI-PUGE-AT-0066]|nr:hypothetical protein BKA62DRAFT_721935 [Auriculariales sp. MPI-PUGE-AT-0066]
MSSDTNDGNSLLSGFSKLSLGAGTDAVPVAASTHAASLPDELLCEIFSYGSAGPGDFPVGSMISSNTGRAKSPFLLSAVCTRWRVAALSSGKLWHYILIGAREPDETIIRYVRILFDRSRDVSIDIVFKHIDHKYDNAYATLFGVLDVHRDRWRRLIAKFTPQMTDQMLKLLYGATPRLRTVQFSLQADVRDNSFNMGVVETLPDATFKDELFLRDAPTLYCLTLVNMPLVWKCWPITRQPKLKMIEMLQNTLILNELWPILHHQNEIEWLFLGAISVVRSADSEVVEPITLPALDGLWIEHEADALFHHYPTVLHMPALVELTLEGVLFRNLPNLFVHVTSTTHLRELCIRRVGAFGRVEVEILQLLERIESVQFMWSPIPAALLTRLISSERDAVMWPRMVYLELYASMMDSESANEHHALALAKMRSEPGPIEGDQKNQRPKWMRCEFVISGDGHSLGEDEVNEIRNIEKQVELANKK